MDSKILKFAYKFSFASQLTFGGRSMAGMLTNSDSQEQLCKVLSHKYVYDG